MCVYIYRTPLFGTQGTEQLIQYPRPSTREVRARTAPHPPTCPFSRALVLGFFYPHIFLVFSNVSSYVFQFFSDFFKGPQAILP
jgi:hypothetical protein